MQKSANRRMLMGGLSMMWEGADGTLLYQKVLKENQCGLGRR